MSRYWFPYVTPRTAHIALAVIVGVLLELAAWLTAQPHRIRVWIFGPDHSVDEAELISVVHEMLSELTAVRPGQLWVRTSTGTTGEVRGVLDGRVRLYDSALNKVVTARQIAADRVAGWRLVRDVPRPAPMARRPRLTRQERRALRLAW